MIREIDGQREGIVDCGWIEEGVRVAGSEGFLLVD